MGYPPSRSDETCDSATGSLIRAALPGRVRCCAFNEHRPRGRALDTGDGGAQRHGALVPLHLPQLLKEPSRAPCLTSQHAPPRRWRRHRRPRRRLVPHPGPRRRRQGQGPAQGGRRRGGRPAHAPHRGEPAPGPEDPGARHERAGVDPRHQAPALRDVDRPGHDGRRRHRDRGRQARRRPGVPPALRLRGREVPDRDHHPRGHRRRAHRHERHARRVAPEGRRGGPPASARDASSPTWRAVPRPSSSWSRRPTPPGCCP